MVATVSKKPMAVWAVSAVPTNRLSAISLSEVEKTPESAMTAAPHTSRNSTKTAVGAAKKNGEAMQQVALIASAVTAAGRRPSRSDAQPPRRDPATPAMPIALKVIMPAGVPASSPRCCLPFTMNIDSHVHRAYSSHMCPK
jgi:hypothetical protein